MTHERFDWGDLIRRIERLTEQNGKCANVNCQWPALVVVHWPVSPGKEWPRYCTGCAAWAVRVGEALGVRLATEPLPGLPQDRPTRRILPDPTGPVVDGE